MYVNSKAQFIFIYLFTGVQSFTKRQLIRDRWANAHLNLFNFNLTFIIGKINSTNNSIENLLHLEQTR